MKTKDSKFPLPQPIELATLAAILRTGPNSKPAGALKVAMEFYLEAVILCRECVSMSIEDLISKFGIEKRLFELTAERIKKAVQTQREDTLVLDPDPKEYTDPARKFLAERGLNRKTARGVLNNIRRMWDARPQGMLTAAYRVSADALIAQCKTVLNGKAIYKIPRFVLEFTADYANERRKKIDLTSWHTRQKHNEH
jgi:hypothetical protein